MPRGQFTAVTDFVASRSSEDPYQTLQAGRNVAAALARAVPDEQDRVALTHRFCFKLISTYWQGLQADYACPWPVSKLSVSLHGKDLSGSALALAESMARAASALRVEDAAYFIGTTYTAMLPSGLRGKLGAYYTPPALTHRLLDLASEAGVDWRTCRTLDPACGGGAFLSPVAERIAEALVSCEPAIILQNLASRLSGFEIDPFSAWMSQVFLEATVLDVCRAANQRLPSMVKVCDSLNEHPQREGFDLVIGNPPYGRVKLTPDQRQRYKRGLYGHANLYGVFTDLALRFTRSGGHIAYVTPTSFLAGEYFKALRRLLGESAPPAAIDFISERKGVFDDVLQETLLAVYRRGGDPAAGLVNFITPRDGDDMSVTAAGSFALPRDPTAPWLVPREPRQAELVERMVKMPHRLRDYGYTVSTGPLVWNRLKEQLRDRPGKDRYPLIWGEAVTPDGRFVFRAEKRNHKPYFCVRSRDKWLMTHEPCVLLQRTTAKEQRRRLIAAELPAAFVEKHGAVVVENHLNMIRPVTNKPVVSIAVLTSLLNSEVLDQAFRCINGSVAVSAFELEALPLPPPAATRRLTTLFHRKAAPKAIEHEIERIFWNG